jgi:phosphoadenosine phosphosulfate reductase
MSTEDEIQLLGKLSGWPRKATVARKLILQALTIPIHWAVSFSGGKDSTVLLDLVLAESPEIDIIWFDDGWDYPETIAFLAATEARLGRRILRVEQPVTSRFWRQEIEYRGDDPVYPHPIDLTYDNWRKEYTGSLLGLRKEESSIRKFTLGRAALYYQSSLGHWHCSPLANWGWRDVWGYIGGRGLAYNPVYDRLGELGVSLDQMRVGPLTAWMVYQYGALTLIKRGWPELFNRFIAKYPEVSSYT